MLFVLLAVACSSGVSFGEVGGETGMFCEGAEDAPEADFAAALTPGGCRFLLTAIDADAGTRLTFDVPAFVDVAAGDDVSVTYTLPDATVRLDVDQGCALAAACGEGATSADLISQTWEATSGTITVSSTPTDDGALTTITFADLVFSDGDGSEVAVDPWTWADVAFYAGE